MKTIQIIAGLLTGCLGLLLLVLAWASAMSLLSLAHLVVANIEAAGYAAVGVFMVIGMIGGMIPLSIFGVAVFTIVAGVAILAGGKKFMP